VENYPTTLTVYTAGEHFTDAKATDVQLQTSAEGETVTAKLLSAKSGAAEVTLAFE